MYMKKEVAERGIKTHYYMYHYHCRHKKKQYVYQGDSNRNDEDKMNENSQLTKSLYDLVLNWTTEPEN